MSIIEAIILGIIQGLTEFLPISSSGHLTVSGKLMGLINESNHAGWTAFMAVIQLGTLVAILAYFWKDIWQIGIDFFKENFIKRKKIKSQSFNSLLGWYIIIGTIPVVVIGLSFKDVIEGALTKNLVVVSSSLILLGIILAIAEKTGKFKKKLGDLTWKDALIIGLAQCLALIPGSSRSGTTITAGLFLGFERETAARFSFLLSIPAIFGSGMLEFIDSLSYISSDGLFNMAIATLFSGISGYLTIEFLLRYLKKNTTFVFVFYRIFIGILILLLIYLGVITK